MSNKIADKERCNNAIFARDKENKSHHCPNAATHVLYNGSQVQSRVCLGCAQKVVQGNTFLKARLLY